MAGDFKFDPLTNRATADLLKQMVELLDKSGDKAWIVKDAMKEIFEESKHVEAALDKVDGFMEVFGKNASLAKEIIKGVNSEVGNMKAGVDLVDKSWQNTTVSISNASKAMHDLQKATSMLGGQAGEAMWKLGEGVLDLGKGIASIATNPVSGLMGILTGLVKIGQVLDEMDKYWAKVNRNVYDTNAALGKMGEYSTDLIGMATTLGLKYVKNFQEVEKLLHSVAQVGVSHEHIAQVTDNILDLSTRWSAMTPEKQLKLMSDYMKDFGLSSINAHNVIKGLLLTAEELKKTNRELDIQQYIDQVTQVSLATRRLNFEWGDAAKYVDVMVRHLGTTPDVLKRAAEFTQAMMQYGQQDLGMQVYMMEKMGVTGNVFQKLGTWTMDTGLRQQAQVGMFEMMIKRVSGKELGEFKGEEGVRELAGVIKLGGYGGVLPGMDEVTIAKVAEKGGEGLKKLLDDMHKAERQDAEHQKKMPGNIAELVSKTTAHTEFYKLWTETQFYTRSITGYSAREIGEKGAKGAPIDVGWYEKHDPEGMTRIKDVMRKIERPEFEATTLTGYDPKIIQAAIVLEQQKVKTLEKEKEQAQVELGESIHGMAKKGVLTQADAEKAWKTSTEKQAQAGEEIQKIKSNIGRLYEIKIIEKPQGTGMMSADTGD